MNRVSCGRREGDSVDRASWPAPTALDNFERAPPRAFERLLGEGTQGERGGIVRIGGRGLEGDDGRDGNGFFSMRGAANTHEFGAKKNPRQNSRDAVAWASYAPMRLHRQNRHRRTWKLQIIA